MAEGGGDSMHALLRSWMESVLDERLPEEESLVDLCRSGAILCRLVNALCDLHEPRIENIVKKHNAKVKNSYQAMENLSHFIYAAKLLGVPETTVFDTTDIYERRDMVALTQTLSALIRALSNNAHRTVTVSARPQSVSLPADRLSNSSSPPPGQLQPQNSTPPRGRATSTVTIPTECAYMGPLPSQRPSSVRFQDHKVTFDSSVPTASAQRASEGDTPGSSKNKKIPRPSVIVTPENTATVRVAYNPSGSNLSTEHAHNHATDDFDDVAHIAVSEGDVVYVLYIDNDRKDPDGGNMVMVSKGGECGLVPLRCLSGRVSDDAFDGMMSTVRGGKKSAQGLSIVKYSRILEAKAHVWMERVLETEFEDVDSYGAEDDESGRESTVNAYGFIRTLRDGTRLCRLANAILPDVIPGFNANPSGVSKTFQEMENVSAFLAAARKIGVRPEDLFETIDLIELKSPNLVLQSLYALSRAAEDNCKTFMGPFLTGPTSTRASAQALSVLWRNELQKSEARQSRHSLAIAAQFNHVISEAERNLLASEDDDDASGSGGDAGAEEDGDAPRRTTDVEYIAGSSIQSIRFATGGSVLNRSEMQSIKRNMDAIKGDLDKEDMSFAEKVIGSAIRRRSSMMPRRSLIRGGSSFNEEPSSPAIDENTVQEEAVPPPPPVVGWIKSNAKVKQHSLNSAHNSHPRLPSMVTKWTDDDYNVDMPALLLKLSANDKKDQLGAGNFGTVTCTTYNNVKVAVKVQAIPDIHGPQEWAGEILDNLVSELSMLRACESCETCVRMLGVGRADNEVYTIMELADRGDLRRVLALSSKHAASHHKLHMKSDECPDWSTLVSILKDAAEGLAFMHKLEMFHRDFKTPNILVTSDWRGKVCDFGFTIWGNSPARLETCAGTEEFMAPEMENGEDFGLPADIFSVGITICEVAAKRRPGKGRFLSRSPRTMFAFEPEVETIHKYLPQDSPVDLIAIASKCCSFVDYQRLKAHEVAAELGLVCDALRQEGR